MRLAGTRQAAAWTLAAPTTFINAYVLHTGFLTAGLLGAGLLWLTTAPIASGVAFGLLAIKPQLGLMIPVALVAGGHWRAITAAAATCGVLGAVSLGLYGMETWSDFFAQLDHVTEIFRSDATNMAMLASIYGLGRTLGLSHTASLVPQALLTLAMAAVVFQLWRSDSDQNLKSAGLVTASLLAAPYLYIYDLTALPLVALLLWRQTRSFDDIELGSIMAAAILAFLFQSSPLPSGFFATLVLGTLVVRRWRSASTASARLSAPRLVGS